MDASTFHCLQLAWVTHLTEALNGGLLPPAWYAMIEQHGNARIADRLTLPMTDRAAAREAIAVAQAPPRARRRLVPSAEASYRLRRRSIAIRHESGHRLVALLEIASPSNKDRAKSVEEFTGKVISALEAGVHVLLIDLFPPGRHDPIGLHGAVWSNLGGDERPAPPGGP